MKLLLVTAAILALALARPEQYRETEDFQYARSSTDEGSKSGYYGAQRGNMGGNYEKAHNMDSLAQNQMSGLVKQVQGELGDGSNTRTGSVYTAANSRGLYGSGGYDLSNLHGRNFNEGTHGSSQSQLSSSAHNSGYSGQSSHSSGYSNSQAQNSRYQSTLAQSLQSSNQQALEEIQGAGAYDYQRQAGYNSGYRSQSGHQSAYTNHHSSNDDTSNNVKTRLVGAGLSRVVIRPGTTVVIPVAAQTYDSSHAAHSARDENAINTEAEVFSNGGQNVHYRPSTDAKHYESSYSYRKQWEKQDTIPAVAVVPLSTQTDDQYTKNSDLYDNTQALHSSNNHYAADTKNAYSSSYQRSQQNSAASQSRYNSGYASQHNAAADSQAYTNAHSSGIASDSNHLGYGESNPKGYQSSYSYHKSWERQGDPYVIYPASGSGSEASQRLTAGSHSSQQYGSHYGHNHYSQSSAADCDENGQVRVTRSADFGQQSQNLEDFGQQSQNLEDFGQQSQNLEDFGQQTQNLNDFGKYNQNLEDFGQQTQDLGQYNQNLEELGQQSRDLTQQSQNNWDYRPPKRELGNLEDFGQQRQSDLGQNKWNLQKQPETTTTQQSEDFDQHSNGHGVDEQLFADFEQHSNGHDLDTQQLLEDFEQHSNGHNTDTQQLEGFEHHSIGNNANTHQLGGFEHHSIRNNVDTQQLEAFEHQSIGNSVNTHQLQGFEHHSIVNNVNTHQLGGFEHHSIGNNVNTHQLESFDQLSNGHSVDTQQWNDFEHSNGHNADTQQLEGFEHHSIGNNMNTHQLEDFDQLSNGHGVDTQQWNDFEQHSNGHNADTQQLEGFEHHSIGNNMNTHQLEDFDQLYNGHGVDTQQWNDFEQHSNGHNADTQHLEGFEHHSIGHSVNKQQLEGFEQHSNGHNVDTQQLEGFEHHSIGNNVNTHQLEGFEHHSIGNNVNKHQLEGFDQHSITHNVNTTQVNDFDQHHRHDIDEQKTYGSQNAFDKHEMKSDFDQNSGNEKHDAGFNHYNNRVSGDNVNSFVYQSAHQNIFKQEQNNFNWNSHTGADQVNIWNEFETGNRGHYYPEDDTQQVQNSYGNKWELATDKQDKNNKIDSNHNNIWNSQSGVQSLWNKLDKFDQVSSSSINNDKNEKEPKNYFHTVYQNSSWAYNFNNKTTSTNENGSTQYSTQNGHNNLETTLYNQESTIPHTFRTSSTTPTPTTTTSTTTGAPNRAKPEDILSVSPKEQNTRNVGRGDISDAELDIEAENSNINIPNERPTNTNYEYASNQKQNKTPEQIESLSLTRDDDKNTQNVQYAIVPLNVLGINEQKKLKEDSNTERLSGLSRSNNNYSVKTYQTNDMKIEHSITSHDNYNQIQSEPNNLVQKPEIFEHGPEELEQKNLEQHLNQHSQYDWGHDEVDLSQQHQNQDIIFDQQNVNQESDWKQDLEDFNLQQQQSQTFEQQNEHLTKPESRNLNNFDQQHQNHKESFSHNFDQQSQANWGQSVEDLGQETQQLEKMFVNLLQTANSGLRKEHVAQIEPEKSIYAPVYSSSKDEDIKNRDIEILTPPQVTTEKPGFWKSVGGKLSSAKDKVYSWFKS